MSSILKDNIKLSADTKEVTLDHLVDLLDWPPLGMILRKYRWSEPLLSLLNDQPPVSARNRLELVGSLIDSLAEKLFNGSITYGEFEKLLKHEEKFVQLLNQLAPTDATTTTEKLELYSRASAAIPLRKKQRDRYQQQRKRLDIFVDRFKNFKEIGTYLFTFISMS